MAACRGRFIASLMAMVLRFVAISLSLAGLRYVVGCTISLLGTRPTADSSV